MATNTFATYGELAFPSVAAMGESALAYWPTAPEYVKAIDLCAWSITGDLMSFRFHRDGNVVHLGNLNPEEVAA